MNTPGSLHINPPSPRTKLIAMAKADIEMRDNAIKDSAAWDYSLDIKHTEQLKRIVARYGWPTIPMVGVEASNDAWLIAQHADHDRVFQKQCLTLLKGLPAGEISLHNIAYLEDRLLVAEHKPQLYGTQFQGVGAKLKPQPIHDRAHVDARRKEMGLGTLAEYKELMLKTYGDS
jgi:hypothetical protein